MSNHHYMYPKVTPVRTAGDASRPTGSAAAPPKPRG
ncbi:MAG: hypothetical protein QOJ21_1996 [Solirubrobacteraceae bacterium]|nr:hypothetical protein [Solirubrobacteraceae bacterium]